MTMANKQCKLTHTAKYENHVVSPLPFYIYIANHHTETTTNRRARFAFSTRQATHLLQVDLPTRVH